MSESIRQNGELPSEISLLLMAHMPEAFRIGLHSAYAERLAHDAKLWDEIERSDAELLQDESTDEVTRWLIEEASGRLASTTLLEQANAMQKAIGAEACFAATVSSSKYGGEAVGVRLCKVSLTDGKVIDGSSTLAVTFFEEEDFAIMDMDAPSAFIWSPYNREHADFILSLYDAQEAFSWRPIAPDLY